MNAHPPDDIPELRPMDRFEWERLLRRIVAPKPVKYIGFVLATFADPDGSRVRPGVSVLAAISGDDPRTIKRILAALRQLGLLDVVSRGGGRYGKGRTTEYRLTCPTDLKERVEVLGPDFKPDSLSGDIWMSPHTPVDKVYEGTSERPLNPVDNFSSGDIQMSPDRPVDKSYEGTSDAPSDSMRGHFRVYEGTSGCPTTNDQPPKPTNPPVVKTVTTVPSPVDVDKLDASGSAANSPVADEEGGGNPEPKPPDRVAALVAEIRAVRPAWSERSIRKALTQAAADNRPFDATRRAFVAVAADPKTTAPGRLNADGPWWSTNPPTAERRSGAAAYATGARCTQSGHEYERMPCKACAADAKAGERTHLRAVSE